MLEGGETEELAMNYHRGCLIEDVDAVLARDFFGVSALLVQGVLVQNLTRE